MPCWYYEKKDLKRETPSIQDGIDFETESRYRKEGARFIIDTGTKMGLRYDTMATGVVYFHRFYMFHSFKEFPRYVTACCCLFLAGKVEETPKKCKDIIKVAKASLSEAQFQQFGEDAKEEVMTLERILLQTIRFDLQVEHPYGYLIKYAKSLKGDKSKLQKMVQMAWTFVNDSLCTTLCLQWEPEVIAIALMYLAGKLSKFEIQDWSGRQPRHIRWWDMFVEDISLEILEDICHQVLDLYSQQPVRTDSPQGNNAPPTATKAQPALPITTPTKPVIIFNNSNMRLQSCKRIRRNFWSSTSYRSKKRRLSCVGETNLEQKTLIHSMENLTQRLMITKPTSAIVLISIVNQPNSHFMETAEFLSEAKTCEKFPLVIASKYNIPFAIDKEGTGFQIKGEIFRIDGATLVKLDELENHPVLYTRQVRRFTLADGSSIEAWVYLLKQYKPEMLELEFLESYDSEGSHGKKYVASADDLQDPEEIE
uniref:Cyclin-K n=1 Tax=Scapholeberis mucronata TaxID=202097 RepID=A0A4Y7NKH9_9CRUS|nr:EOG090X09KD [Scapholeberis mucronata]SVE93740.1 EOG090X09KD [Scapholeberis mucronata]